MILTKDNLLRYVREKKAVTPTMVSEDFETTTMIASAALSEISKDKTIATTHLKLASSPYYYDPRQKECLIELGEKHLSKYEKDIFLKLKQHEILSDNALTIQEKLAIEKIKDFAMPLEINIKEKELKFWVWYLRDFNETKKQIIEALNQATKAQEQPKKEEKVKPVKTTTPLQTEKIELEEIKPKEVIHTMNPSVQSMQASKQTSLIQIEQDEHLPAQINNNISKPHFTLSNHANKNELYIDNYFKEHYLNIENKIKQEKGISYNLTLQINNLKIQIDSFYYYKKTTENDIMKFYTSSLRPKIIFVENAPKKIINMADNLENLFIIDLR